MTPPAGPNDVVVGHGPSKDDHLYYTVIGIGVERATVARYLEEVGVDIKTHNPFKAKVALASIGLEVWGESLASLLDQGEVLGPNEDGTGYMVGEITQLINAGTEPIGPDDAQLMDVVIDHDGRWTPGERPEKGGDPGATERTNVTTEQKAEKKAAEKKTGEKVAPKKAKAVKAGVCVCGCGQPTKGGNFGMGHDSKLQKMCYAYHDKREIEFWKDGGLVKKVPAKGDFAKIAFEKLGTAEDGLPNVHPDHRRYGPLEKKAEAAGAE